MLEYYPEIRATHIHLVLTSGALVFFRGLFAVGGAMWPRSVALLYLDYGLHTSILTAAMMLMVITGQYPFADGWLTVKVTLYLGYVALSFLALQRGDLPRARRTLYWLGALIVFSFIYSVARTREPSGLLAGIV